MRKILLGVLGLSFVVAACNESTKAVSDPDVGITGGTIEVSGIEVLDIGTAGSSNYYSTVSLKLGDTAKLKTRVMPPTAENRSLSWRSSAPEVVRVHSDGRIVAEGIGTSVIIVTAHNGVVVRVPIRVVKPENFVEMTGLEFANVGDVDTDGAYPVKEVVVSDGSFVIESVVVPSDATNPSLVWSSSQSGIATVRDGVVTLVGIGFTTITATSYSGHTASVKIKVVEGVADEIAVHFLNAGDFITMESGLTTYAEMNMSLRVPVQLEYSVLPEWLTDKSLTWTVEDDGVATVVAGLIQPVSVGKTNITATSSTLSKAVLPIQVVAADEFRGVRSVVFTNVGGVESDNRYPARHIIIGAEAFRVMSEVVPADASNPILTWSSSDDSVATVRNGYVRGVSRGDAMITATAFGGIVAELPVVVSEAVVAGASVKFLNAGATTYDENGWTSYEEMFMAVGRSYQIDSIVLPTDTPDQSLTWYTSHGELLTVENGLVTPLQSGAVEVRAQGTHSALAILPITIVDDSLYMDVLNLEFTNVGETDSTGAYVTMGLPLILEPFAIETLVEPAIAMNKVLTWSSSDPTVATVEYGVVTPVSVGEATITATTYGGLAVSMVVVVTEGEVDVNFVKFHGFGEPHVDENLISSYNMTYLNIENNYQIYGEVFPLSATDKSLKWSSTDEGVVQVNSAGMLEIQSVGTASIIALSPSGASAILPVTVIDGDFVAVTSIDLGDTYDESLGAYTLSMDYGTTHWLQPVINPNDATFRTITWSSEDANVASVSAGGMITASGEGVTTITGEGHNGVTVDIVVDVNIIEVTSVSWKKGYNDIMLALESPSSVISLSSSVEVSPQDASFRWLDYLLVDESDRPGTAGAVVSSGGILSNLKVYGRANIQASTQDGLHTDTVVIYNGNRAEAQGNLPLAKSPCKNDADYILYIPMLEWTTSYHVSSTTLHLNEYNEQIYVEGMEDNPNIKVRHRHEQYSEADAENPGADIYYHKIFYSVCSLTKLPRPLVVHIGMSEYIVEEEYIIMD